MFLEFNSVNYSCNTCGPLSVLACFAFAYNDRKAEKNIASTHPLMRMVMITVSSEMEREKGGRQNIIFILKAIETDNFRQASSWRLNVKTSKLLTDVKS